MTTSGEAGHEPYHAWRRTTLPGPAPGQSGLLAAQGLGILAAGAAASWIGPSTVVAIAGVLGVLAAAVLACEWARHRGVLAELAADRQPVTPGVGGPRNGALG